MSKSIQPRVIPGVPGEANRGTLDWGMCGLVGYGAYATVVVIDPNTGQIVQVFLSFSLFLYYTT